MNATIEHAESHGLTHTEAGGRFKVAAGGSMVEAISSIGAVVLAILGLAGILPSYLTAIAVIAVGVSLLFEGGTVGARFTRLLATRSGNRTSYASLGGGMTAEFLAGAAGIVLGVLSLLGVVPAVLPAVAAIAFGGALLLGSRALVRLGSLEAADDATIHTGVQEVAHEAAQAAAGAQVLAGLAAVILGILAVVDLSPMSLTLVALLCSGAAIALSGTAVSARIMGLVA